MKGKRERAELAGWLAGCVLLYFFEFGIKHRASGRERERERGKSGKVKYVTHQTERTEGQEKVQGRQIGLEMCCVPLKYRSPSKLTCRYYVLGIFLRLRVAVCCL